MAKRSEFVEYVVEQFVPLGEVSAKSMFGGWGIYREDRIFALVTADTLYVKVDDTSRAEFEATGLKPFRFARRDREIVATSYYQVPDAALDDRESLFIWARKGIAAAARAAQKSPGKKPRRKCSNL